MIAGSLFWTIVVYGLAALVIGLVVVYREPIFNFVDEVMVELRKCTWPWDMEQTGLRRYKTLIDSTVMVCVIALVLAAYVTTFDFLISKLVGAMVKFKL
jgi:preprotein translocase subunit SecE